MPALVTEIITLSHYNTYQIWERMDRRAKCTWDCAELGRGFFGTVLQLQRYLKRQNSRVIGQCRRKLLRVETAVEII